MNRYKNYSVLHYIFYCILIAHFEFYLPSTVGLLFIIILVLRRKKDNDSELSLARTPLLRKDRPPGRFYGIPCDAEPVYAGW